MTVKRVAGDVLDAQFLEMRHQVLGLAADFDRLSRAVDAASLRDDPRFAKLHRAIGLLCEDGVDRAQRVQMVFSDEYDAGWRSG